MLPHFLDCTSDDWCIEFFCCQSNFLPPKFETKIYYNSMNISSDIFVWFKLVLNDTSEFHNIKQDGDQLNSRINKLEKIFDYYNEERPLTKHIYQQNRKNTI